MPFVFKYSLKMRIVVVVSLAAVFFIIIGFANYLGLLDELQYIVVEKIQNLFSVSDHTLDSGSFRSFTSRIGLAIFNDNPLLGVGVGNSVFYMHLYETKMGIVTWGETLTMGVLPLSLYSNLLAEQGIIGGIALVLVASIIICKCWKNRNKGELGKVFYLGTLVNFGVMFTISTLYSLFMWVFLALSIGYYRVNGKK